MIAKTLRYAVIILPLFYGVYISFFQKQTPILFPEDKSTITGFIDDYPEERMSSNRYRVKIESFNNTAVTETARILVVTSPHQVFSYGQKIELYGQIELPEDFITDSGKTFDYDSYLKLEKVYGIMRDPEITEYPGFAGNKITSLLFNIRSRFARVLNTHLNPNDSVLSRGVLLGERAGITSKFRDNLARTSTSHIIAISGYNITIVSEIIMKISAPFSLLWRTLFGASGIIIFIALAGGGSSVLRAGIMAGILLYSRWRGKEYNAIYALLLAAALLVSINPLSLRYDVGFHLSLLATFGLIVFQSPIATRLRRFGFNKFFAEILGSTLAATIMTLPYIVYFIGILSIIGIFANIIIVPLIPILMLFSFLTGLFGFMAAPFAWVTHVVSEIIFRTVNTFGDIPWAAKYVDHIPAIYIVLIYVSIFYTATRALKKAS